MKRFMGTPGPWKYTIRNVNEMMTTFHGVVMGDTYIEIATRNEREDAKLLAAAPDLLEALQTIQAKMSDFIKLANEVGINDADGFYLAAATGAEEQARAAISKALGEG